MAAQGYTSEAGERVITSRKLRKALRLIGEGRVERTAPDRFEIRGDTTTHHVKVRHSTLSCSCRAATFGGEFCSHVYSVECLLAREAVA